MTQPDFGALQSTMLNLVKEQKKNPNAPIDFGAVIEGLIDNMAPNLPQNMKDNFKQFGKTAASAMESMNSEEEVIDMKPKKGSKILLDEEEEEESMKEPSRNNINVLSDLEEVEDFSPRTEDIVKFLDLELKDFYTGTTKKVSVTRDRLKQDPTDSSKLISVKETRKFMVTVPKGAVDEQYITYSKQGNEKIGYDTGDIIVVLKQNGNPRFERIHTIHLVTTVPISLYEAYAIPAGMKISIPFIDGTNLELKYNSSDPVITDNMTMCAGDYGFPVYGKDKRGKLYINFRIVYPESIDTAILSKLFPAKNSVNSKIDNSVTLNNLSAKEFEEIAEESESDSEYSGSSESS